MKDDHRKDSMHDFYSADAARQILTRFKRWAVVGASTDPARPSFGVMRYLINNGYDVVPVNPNQTACQNLDCYPDLRSVPGEIEVVDLFRRSEFVGPHVDEAIEVGARAIWMQLDVIDEAAAKRAADAGLLVVMDRCPAIEHPRLPRAG